MKMKELIKRYVPRKVFYFIRDIVYPEKIQILEGRLSSLFLTYHQSIAAPSLSQKTALRNAEFKVYSKHGGDGIVAYIFSKIGTMNHTFVEMGVEDGTECNTSNLSLNFGWNGLMIDANEDFVRSAKRFFKNKLGSQVDAVQIVNRFVDAENINALISDHGIKGDIDLLSIDIDGNDYWVWKAITAVNPRVVIMEYNAAFGLNSVTVKYNTDFYYKETHQTSPLYFGASLAALSKLAKEKGYILAGCDCHGHDAYFIRKDVAEGKFVELSPEEAFYPNPFTLGKFGSLEKQYELLKDEDIQKI